jgi:hypothetical protein
MPRHHVALRDADDDVKTRAGTRCDTTPDPDPVVSG